MLLRIYSDTGVRIKHFISFKKKGAAALDDEKRRPVADIVFLLDVTRSMQDCLDAVKSSILDFIAGNSGSALPSIDWRMKIVGYRNSETDPSGWFIDNPFVSNAAEVEAQLSANNMNARGGGDDPSSLLDALFKLATMDQSGAQDPTDPNKWRARGTTGRLIIFITGGIFKHPMKIPEAAGGTVTDVITAIAQHRMLLAGFGPEWVGYDALATAEHSQIIRVAKLADTPALAGFDKSLADFKVAQLASQAELKAAFADPSYFSTMFTVILRVLWKARAIN